MTGQVAKNALYLTVASVGQKIIAFVYFLFLARVMMPDLTGQYFLALSIMTMYSVIAEFGITSVTTREIAKDPTQAPQLIPHALALKLPLMTVAVVGAILTGRFLGYEPEVQTLIAISSVVLVIDALQVFFYGVLRGFQALQYEAVGIFSGMMTTAILGGLVLVFAPSLPLLVVALIAGSSVNLLVSSHRVARRVGWKTLIPRWSARDAKTIMRMAFPFALAAIFVKVYSYIDSIFISKFLDTTAVGLYAIAYKFTYAFQFLPLAFVAALYPGMSAVAGKDDVALNRILCAVCGTWRSSPHRSCLVSMPSPRSDSSGRRRICRRHRGSAGTRLCVDPDLSGLSYRRAPQRFRETDDEDSDHGRDDGYQYRPQRRVDSTGRHSGRRLGRARKFRVYVRRRAVLHPQSHSNIFLHALATHDPADLSGWLDHACGGYHS